MFMYASAFLTCSKQCTLSSNAHMLMDATLEIKLEEMLQDLSHLGGTSIYKDRI